jgi:hypothetical protein
MQPNLEPLQGLWNSDFLNKDAAAELDRSGTLLKVGYRKLLS